MLGRYAGLMVFVFAMVMLMPMAGMAEAATAAPAADTGGAVRNDRENNTIRGFRFLVELSFGIWCSWVQSGCKTRRIWCTHSFRFAVISERTMARGRKKKFSDYIRTEVARIYRLLHNVGTLRRVPIFHFGCIFIGLTFLCP